LCIFESSLWDVLHFGSSSCGFFAFLEETHRMFLKFFTGFLEVLYGIFCIFGSSSWDCANLGSSI
jgi:hypothetical protein